MSQLIHIADRVLNRPLLVTRDKAQVILSALAGRIGVNAPEMSRFEGSNWDGAEWKPYKVTREGVGIVSITGSLVNRGAWIGANSGLTSYEGIQHQLKKALEDDAVHAVILDLHSPGGEAVGAFETAEAVRKLAATKRTVAVVNGMAASAAYAIASGAAEIVTTETGVSGSIGVVLLHADFSRQLDREGITPTLIFAGEHKVDGNPFEPLPKNVRTDLEAEVEAFYDLFIRTVALGRGDRLTAEMARATQARTFIGQQAVGAGLADRVGTFESVLAEFSRDPVSAGRTTSGMKGNAMTEKTGAPAAENAGIAKTDHDKAVADARAAGVAEGTKAEQDRVKGLTALLGKGHDAIVTAAIADGKSTAGEAAIRMVEAGLAAAPATDAGLEDVLARMDRAATGVSSTVSATGGSAAPAKASTPDGWRAEWEASADLQAEFVKADDYVAFRQAESSGKIRVLGARK